MDREIPAGFAMATDKRKRDASRQVDWEQLLVEVVAGAHIASCFLEQPAAVVALVAVVAVADDLLHARVSVFSTVFEVL